MSRKRQPDRGKVVGYWRGARRHPRWDTGSPPGRPRRQRRRSLTSGLGLGVGVVTLALVVLPAIGDGINGYVTKTDGCRVVGVVDGDTVRLFCPTRGIITGRVLAYDTPELRARCLREFILAKRATWALRMKLWSASAISARTEGQDRYGRALTVLLADGQGVAGHLVGKGLARWYNGGRRAGWCHEGIGGFNV